MFYRDLPVSTVFAIHLVAVDVNCFKNGETPAAVLDIIPIIHIFARMGRGLSLISTDHHIFRLTHISDKI